MKLIHSADLHLGSRIDSKFPKDIAEERREEVRNSFRRMVQYAEEEGVKVILLSGDVFDSDKPFKKDKEFFYSVVMNHPEIDFLYLRGNHDKMGDNKAIDNLKTFSAEWTSYTYGELVISGIETVKENATSLYASLSLDEKKTNIVMLHGQVGDSSGMDLVNLTKLREKGIDYLALGHIHGYSEMPLDRRGIAVYSGCLEGRGFDETGTKGFVLLEVGEEVIHRFVPFSVKPIEKVTVDVTGLEGAYEIYLRARDLIKNRDGIYRFELCGEVTLYADSVNEDLKKYLSDHCAFADIKDRTKKSFDIHAYDNDFSLKGEFVRGVYASKEHTEEEKLMIIAYGLKALAGEEVEG